MFFMVDGKETEETLLWLKASVPIVSTPSGMTMLPETSLLYTTVFPSFEYTILSFIT